MKIDQSRGRCNGYVLCPFLEIGNHVPGDIYGRDMGKFFDLQKKLTVEYSKLFERESLLFNLCAF